MERVKRLLDPDGILNPGVVLNANPRCHLRGPQALPDDLAARRPLHRVRLLRAALPLARPHAHAAPAHRGDARARAPAAPRARPRTPAWRDSLERDFAYDGVADLRGRLDVPGRLPGEDRHRRAHEGAEGSVPLARPRAAIATVAATRFSSLAAADACRPRRSARCGPRPLGARAVALVTQAAHALAPGCCRGCRPRWRCRGPPRASRSRRPRRSRRARRSSRGSVVYFPSCLTRVIGPLPGENGTPTARAMREVLSWAGFNVRVPDGASGLCCGMAFASKGYSGAARAAARRTAEALWRATSGGRLLVVTDASPCAGTLADAVAADPARVEARGPDARLPGVLGARGAAGPPDPPRRPGTAILHPTCTLVKAGGLDDLLARRARARRVRGACRSSPSAAASPATSGFLVPELTASATAAEAAEVRGLLDRSPGAGRYSTCRTCEIGMSRAVGRAVPARCSHLVHEAVDACLSGCSTRSRRCRSFPTYLVLMALSALENVFPPVPADTAVALGAFLARRGEVSVVPLTAPVLARQHGLRGGDLLRRPQPRARLLRDGWGRKVMPPEVARVARRRPTRAGARPGSS